MSSNSSSRKKLLAIIQYYSNWFGTKGPIKELPSELRVDRPQSNKWFGTYNDNDDARRQILRDRLTQAEARGDIHFAAGQDERAATGQKHVQCMQPTLTLLVMRWLNYWNNKK